MRSHPRIAASVILFALLSIVASGVANAQSGVPNMPGGTHLVVSRASDSAPTASTAPSLITALAATWRWNVIALANARVGAWSFAPALVAELSRPAAVRRRAVH